MTVIAAALIGTLVITVMSAAGLIKSLTRSHARERDLLVNQIMHLSGRTWTPPPADDWKPAAAGEPLVREWTATPEQDPYV